MTAIEKAAGMMLVTPPATAYKNHYCTDHSTRTAYLLSSQRERHVRILAGLRVAGFTVLRRPDGSYSAIHQHGAKHLPTFAALESLARSLQAARQSQSGAPGEGDGNGL